MMSEGDRVHPAVCAATPFRRSRAVALISGAAVACLCAGPVLLLALSARGVRALDGIERGDLTFFGMPILRLSGPGAMDDIFTWRYVVYYTLMFVCGGIGALLGLVIATRLRRHVNREV
jgi:hypothetical protein